MLRTFGITVDLLLRSSVQAEPVDDFVLFDQHGETPDAHTAKSLP